MVKKLFALASVTALTGLMAATAASGCSSTTTSSADTNDAAQSGDTSKPPTPPKDAAPSTDDAATAPAVCPSTTEITAADIEMTFKWVAPKPIQNVCTQKNLDDLKALFVKGMGGAKYTEIKTTLGANCAACAFSKKDAANWQLFVEDGIGFISNSTASCLATVENAACGKAAFEFDICLRSVCSQADCGMDQTAISACQKKAVKGACKKLSTDFGTACGANLQADLTDKCTGPVADLAVVCGGGPDGGLDSSVK